MVQSVRVLGLLLLALGLVRGDKLSSADRFFPESHHTQPAGWTHSPDAHHDPAISVLLAVRQQHLDQVEDAFWRVSDPASPDYGQHWKLDRLAKVIDCKSSAEKIKSWLQSASPEAIVSTTVAGEFVRASLPRTVAEELFGIRLAPYCVDGPRPKHMPPCRLSSVDQYSVPLHLQDHIEFVSGLRLPRLRQPAMTAHEHAIATGVKQRINASAGVQPGVPVVTVIEARDRAFQV